MDTLIDRLKQRTNVVRFEREIHADLSYAEIVERVKVFIQNLEELNITFAFGTLDFDDPELATEDIYDPFAFLEAEPDKRDLIEQMVSHDLEHHLSILLSRQESCAHSYNILVFGCAMYVEKSLSIPEELRQFLVDHLLNPSKYQKKGKRGQPPKTQTETRLIGSAVSFAIRHGLYATRNNASVKPPLSVPILRS